MNTSVFIADVSRLLTLAAGRRIRVSRPLHMLVRRPIFLLLDSAVLLFMLLAICKRKRFLHTSIPFEGALPSKIPYL